MDGGTKSPEMTAIFSKNSTRVISEPKSSLVINGQSDVCSKTRAEGCEEMRPFDYAKIVKESNPFDNDTGSHEFFQDPKAAGATPSVIADTPILLSEIIEEQSNPFDDKDFSESNPFGAEDEASAASPLKVISRKALMSEPIATSPVFKAPDLEFLQVLGFDMNMSANALMTRSRELAIDYLRGISNKSKMPIWEAPLSIRIGSWLPNVLDEASGSEHTIYFLSICCRPFNYRLILSPILNVKW
jgi:hypothetical protein